jgi:hypothetical protein
MVVFSSLVSVGLLVASSASAAPVHQKRIAQTIVDSTAKWVAACVCLYLDFSNMPNVVIINSKRLVADNSAARFL